MSLITRTPVFHNCLIVTGGESVSDCLDKSKGSFPSPLSFPSAHPAHRNTHTFVSFINLDFYLPCGLVLFIHLSVLEDGFVCFLWDKDSKCSLG